jgi:uncharacterized surface protein with fasciclin (FAS1) repeats
MKKLVILLGFIAIILGNYSCNDKIDVVAKFKDMRQTTIRDYMLINKDKYSSFLSLLHKANLEGTLTAYNPHGVGYTLFLPDNNAIDKFIQESNRFKSLDDMMSDSGYVYDFCRYHVVNLAIKTNDFPFGALPALTLSKDYLTVSFVVQPDTSYYLINNTAVVTKQNIELSNGYIHVIGKALTPITNTTYGWFLLNPGYSIFKAAIDVTGLKDTLDLNSKEKAANSRSFTLLLEHDSVFNKRGIHSLSDLENLISPGNTNYTSKNNPLYNFVAYHVLKDSHFLDNLFGLSTNYDTYSDIPLNINGVGNDIKINLGKESFDTIIHQSDTTIINYVGFYYDQSNIVTQSGVIHFINQILRQHQPSRATQTFEFWEEPLFNTDRLLPGTYVIDDHASLNVVQWSGADLSFVKLPHQANIPDIAWSNDYVLINGDFVISYTIPALVQGSYTVYLQADAFSTTNAVIEIYIDGKKLGGLFDLSSGGSAAFPFYAFLMGTIEFRNYESHVVEVRSLIPGRFCWDYVQFVPLIN